MGKGKRHMAKSEITTPIPPKPTVAELLGQPEPPKTEFVPHKLDPLLSYREAGRLIGVTHTCIRKWVETGLLDVVRPSGSTMRNRIRKSDLIKVSGVAAFARRSPFLWEQEGSLPEGYEYQEDWPAPREVDQIKYWPVPLAMVQPT